MKWLPFILALYFLGLAFIACTDGNAISDIENSEQIVLAADSHTEHDHASDPTDGCSPLCTCHCCHVHITLGEVAEATPFLNYLSPSPSYLNNFQDSDHFDFFVPPKA